MEENNVVVIEENSLAEKKTKNFYWEKVWAWSSLILSAISPLIGIGVGMMAISMSNEEHYDEVYTVSLIGMGIGGFMFVLDLLLNFVSLF